MGRSKTGLARVAAVATAVALASAMLASGGAARAAKDPGPTTGPYIMFDGANDVCPGLTAPVYLGDHDLVSPVPIAGVTYVGPIDLFVQSEVKVSTEHGRTPDVLRRYLAGSVGGVPDSADITWTVIRAAGFDAAGVPFTIDARLARLTPNVMVDQFVGTGTMKITRDDGAKVSSDSAVSYLGSRSFGWVVTESDGVCAGPKGN